MPTAAPVVDIVSEAVPPSALSMALSKLPLVAVLDQDLKHLLDRYNKTLTCTQFNRSQFALATATGSQCMSYWCPDRDALIRGRCRAPVGRLGDVRSGLNGRPVAEGLWPGGRIQVLPACDGAPAVMRTLKAGEPGMTAAELAALDANGAWASTFDQNRYPAHSGYTVSYFVYTVSTLCVLCTLCILSATAQCCFVLCYLTGRDCATRMRLVL